jgi:hypothetical protein
MKTFSTSEFSREPMDINEFMDLARDRVDPNRSDTLAEMSEPLWRLARNIDYLRSKISTDLSRWSSPSALSFYSAQSCLLASESNLVVRLNIWPVLPDEPRRKKVLSAVLSYYDTHDHNFSFLTANAWGPGYRTDVYEVDPSSVVGYPGEPVSIISRGTHTLDESCVLLFEARKDIHRQLPPEALSLSVNLMLTNPASGLSNQFMFDTDRSVIDGYVESFSTKRVSGVSFAGGLGGESTVVLLRSIIRKHPCARTKVEAYRQIVKLEPEALDLAELRNELAASSSLALALLKSLNAS